VRPRVLFVGRTRYRLPLDASLARKWDALAEVLDLRVLASSADGSPGDAMFRLAPAAPAADGAFFYGALPLRVARELRAFRPDAIVAESPYEGVAAALGRRLARSSAKLVVEVHGDWGAATRLYGSRSRRALSPVGDGVAGLAVRHADAVRTISSWTSDLVRSEGVEPAATFPAYIDVEPFLERPPAPLPAQRRALFVGALEPSKNVDVLAAAWRLAAPRVPEATLHVVGDGSRRDVVAALVRDLPERAAWDPRLGRTDVVRAFDEATVLVLPSASEGLGRVIIEAFVRGRPAVASRVGGIPDLVQDGVNGLLVPPGDAPMLADAIVRVLTDRPLAERLATGAHASAGAWVVGPDDYARRVLALVERVIA